MNFKRFYKPALMLLAATIIQSCGEAVVEVKNVSYEPRIVVEGYLFPGQPVSDIRITRNFPLDANLQSPLSLLPDYRQTSVTITDESTGFVYPLTLNAPDSVFDIDAYTYGYSGGDLNIEHGGSYTLDVQTVIDGQTLSAKSTTVVPQRGLAIKSINYEQLVFADTDEAGETLFFEMQIQRSPGTTFYANSVRALNTNFEDFITEHLVGDLEREDYDENFDEFVFDTNWIQNTPSFSGESTMRLFWFSFFFYGRHEVIVYAADKNYREFLQTFANTQEFDGNFHEARFNFEGDAVGVFGSMTADTIYVEVLKP